VTVGAYFAAAYLCWRCARRSPVDGKGWSGTRLFWYLFTAALVFLGFNKQLDLQTWLTLFGNIWRSKKAGTMNGAGFRPLSSEPWPSEGR
jgi:hypothetical protein